MQFAASVSRRLNRPFERGLRSSSAEPATDEERQKRSALDQLAKGARAFSLLADAVLLREVEVVAEGQHLVELEVAIVGVDLLIGELRVRAATVVVEATGVPREGHAAPLEADRVPLVDVEREAQAEGGRDGYPTLARIRRLIVRLTGLASVGIALLALAHADEGGAGEEVQIGVEVDVLEQRELSTEGDRGDLRRGDPVDCADLLLELGTHVGRRQSSAHRGSRARRALSLDVATALVHPSCVRAMARTGIYAYIDEKGKIRRIRGEASEAKPVAVDGEVDSKFFLAQSWLKDLERFVNRGEHVLLIGPAGCGKTEGTEQVFKKRKQQLMIMSCTPSTDSDDVEGKIDLREGSTVFSPSVVTEAVKEGYGLLIDEADAAPAEACFAFYRCLDGKDMRITRQGFDGIIPLHKDFRCVATQNTEGRGDSAGLFHGRSLQDEAFLDRWPAAIRVSYPGQDDEVLILHKRTGCPKSEVLKVVEAANIMRKAMSESSLMFTVSMRRTQAICQNLVYGDSPEKAWLYSCLNRATSEDQTAMREILIKIYGSRFAKRT